MNNLEEIWKIIENFPDYMISDWGRVKSFKRYKDIILLKQGKGSNGYLQVDLCKNGKQHPKSIHRLVLEAFKPNEDLNKTECNHKDGNKENNYVENLEWCTRSDNMKHAFKIGLQKGLKGEKNPMFGKHKSEEWKKKQSEKMKDKYKDKIHPISILTEEKVIEIWKFINEGILTQKEIAKKFGVDQATISNIKTGRTWKHVK